MFQNRACCAPKEMPLGSVIFFQPSSLANKVWKVCWKVWGEGLGVGPRKLFGMMKQ